MAYVLKFEEALSSVGSKNITKHLRVIRNAWQFRFAQV